MIEMEGIEWNIEDKCRKRKEELGYNMSKEDVLWNMNDGNAGDDNLSTKNFRRKKLALQLMPKLGEPPLVQIRV